MIVYLFLGIVNDMGIHFVYQHFSSLLFFIVLSLGVLNGRGKPRIRLSSFQPASLFLSVEPVGLLISEWQGKPRIRSSSIPSRGLMIHANWAQSFSTLGKCILPRL